MKHRTTRKQSTTTSSLDVASPLLVDSDRSKMTKGKRRYNKSVSLTIWLGGSVVLIGLGLLLRHTDAHEATVQEAIVDVQDAVVHNLGDSKNTMTKSLRKPLYGNLTYGLYRFEASRLGPEYLKAVEKFDEYIGQTVDPVGAQFAAQHTRAPGTRKFHQECFLPPNEKTLLNMERNKKMHSAKGKDRLEFLREEQELFYGPGVTINDTMITQDRKWAWRTAAVYSAQYAGKQNEFRRSVEQVLNLPGQDGFFGGMVSGTFWYPPNAIREWHTNVWDMQIDERTGEPRLPWRMYYVRQKAATRDGGLDTSRSLQADPSFFSDKSAMHLVEGPGIPPERLEELGAYRLDIAEKQEVEGPSVWRIPDQNGYVSLFRLQPEKPYRWHCIVSDDTVHRYSMGISMDDEGVEAMLKHAGVEL